MNRHLRRLIPEPFDTSFFIRMVGSPRLCPKQHKVAAGKPLHAGAPRDAHAIRAPSGNSKSSRKPGYAWLSVQSTSPSGASVSSAIAEKRTRARAEAVGLRAGATAPSSRARLRRVRTPSSPDGSCDCPPSPASRVARGVKGATGCFSSSSQQVHVRPGRPNLRLNGGQILINDCTRCAIVG